MCLLPCLKGKEQVCCRSRFIGLLSHYYRETIRGEKHRRDKILPDSILLKITLAGPP